MRVCWLCNALLMGVLAYALMLSPSHATEEKSTPLARNPIGDMTTFIYFTGIGCPHCANVDPVLLKKKVRESNLLVVEYEIYQDSANASLMMAYDQQFKVGLGVPMIIANGEKGSAVVGDTPVLEALDAFTLKYRGNGLTLPAGNRSFASLPLTDLPRMPKLWYKNRVVIKKDAETKESDPVKAFLINNVLPIGAKPIQEKTVALSDDKVTFREAYSFGGWVLMRD